MGSEIKLSELDEVLEELTYPVTTEEATAELGDVTIRLADGETTFGEVMAWTEPSTFGGPDELETELFNALPREAVGEPYQSEGEG